TALISFGVGTLACALALLAWPRGRTGLVLIRDAVRDRRMTPWFLFGGVAGALMVTTQGLTAPVLGVALFTVALVGGQAIGSLVMDRRGVGAMAATPLTPPRMVGAALAVAAVIWAVSDRLHGDVAWLLLVLPFLAGIAVSWQQAVNGQLRQQAQSALSATFVSFLAGTAVLAVAAAVEWLVAGPAHALPAEPWLYLGGLIGVVFVAGAAAIVPFTG
ncbi:EamA-like transporter family protein, partial [Schumannella luteola]